MSTLYSKTIFVVLLSTLIISGCTTNNMKQTVNNQSILSVSDLQFWQLEGKIAFKSPEDKFSASLHWQQRAENTTLNLLSMFGTNIFKLATTPNLSTILVDGKTYQDSNSERLLYSITGRSIPVNELSLAIKGVTPPSASNVIMENEKPSELTFVDSLNQHWAVTYQEYKVFKNLRLPSKINLRSGDISVKIHVKKWIY